MKKLPKFTLLASTFIFSSILAPSPDSFASEENVDTNNLSNQAEEKFDLENSQVKTTESETSVENSENVDDLTTLSDDSNSTENSLGENSQSSENSLTEENVNDNDALNNDLTEESKESEEDLDAKDLEENSDKDSIEKDQSQELENPTNESTDFDTIYDSNIYNENTNGNYENYEENSSSTEETSSLEVDLEDLSFDKDPAELVKNDELGDDQLSSDFKEMYKSEDGKELLVLNGEVINYYIDNVLIKNKDVEIDGKFYSIDNLGKVSQAFDKWIEMDGKSYYVDKDGKLLTSESKVNKAVVLFSSDGSVSDKTSYVKGGKGYKVSSTGVVSNPKNTWIGVGDDSFYNDENGNLVIGMKKIGKNTYYFDISGIMEKDKLLLLRENFFDINSKGIVNGIIDSWVNYNGKKYYSDKSGKILKGIQKVSNKNYYFTDNGSLSGKTTVIKDDRGYKVDKDGLVSNPKKAWLGSGKTSYYNDENGKLVTGIRKTGANTYYFENNGKLSTETFTLISDSRGYRVQKGILTNPKNSWLGVGSTSYYNDGNGKLVTGIRKTGANTYYFENNGKLSTKTFTLISDSRGYRVQKGILTNPKSSWLGVGSTSYYNDENGKLVTGIRKTGANIYYFENNGKLSTRSFTYIAADKGYKIKKGIATNPKNTWLGVGKKSYYNNSKGNLVKGAATIGKNTYFFDQNGVQTSGSGIFFIDDKFYSRSNQGTISPIKYEWVSYNGKNFHTDYDGSRMEGVYKIGSYYYNLTPYGKARDYYVVQDGVTYSFDSEGKGTIISTTKPNKDLDVAIGWMYDGMNYGMTYDMGAGRTSEDSADCSSAVFRAMIAGGFLKEGSTIGNTETLFAMGNKGSVLKQVKESEIRYGDIFVAGTPGNSLGGGGHTGFILNRNEIIHCNYSDNGINVTERVGRMGDASGKPVRYYRLVKGSSEKVKF